MLSMKLQRLYSRLRVLYSECVLGGYIFKHILGAITLHTTPVVSCTHIVDLDASS